MSEATVTREEFEALRAQIADLQKQISVLAPVAAAPAAVPAAAPEKEGIPEETLLIIAAAVAAYLGKRATFRIIRHGATDTGWITQGRASIAASHQMPSIHGW